MATRYDEMDQEQAAKVRRLERRLCTKAVGKKEILEHECEHCQSPCGYGVELLSVLGLEAPKREHACVFDPAQGMRHGSLRAIIRGKNRRRRG